VQRKVYIDYLQKNKLQDELSRAAAEYRDGRAEERALMEPLLYEEPVVSDTSVATPASEDNTNKTYRDFAEKWLPFHARKKIISPNTYDSYVGNLNNHVLPYFGERIMSTITVEDIDNFIDCLSQKSCKGSKSYHKSPRDIPKLSSGTIKKCYNVLTAGFPTAKKWKYITEIPETSAPSEKWKKRKAWNPDRVYSALTGIQDDKLLHLAVHIAFVCSLRAGETIGIDTKTIDFRDRSFWVAQEVQRVSDESLKELSENEIIRVFPKKIPSSKSSMILKGPKTEGSYRKQYLTEPLLREIRERLDEIERHKEFFGEEYRDYGLLLCQPDGRPIDPKNLCKWFKVWQCTLGIEERDQIEFQGLRKSGQMHKVRLTQNNYQLVAENSGQSPEVLMSNYNEVLDSEKRALSALVENSFYPQQTDTKLSGETETILSMLKNNPELSNRILQTLLLETTRAKQA
jgi:integrase